VIPTDKPHLNVAAHSHTGETRTNNEDRFSVTAYRMERTSVPALLAIVADGIGGHNAGEVASDLTVETIVNRLTASRIAQPTLSLQQAILEANDVVAKASRTNDAQQGMGSTVVTAWIIGSRLYTATVGDSRIYLLRDGSIRQISIDHTWVQEAIEHDIIQPEQARDHPQAHVLRRYIGSQIQTEPDIRLRMKDNESDKQSESNQGMTLQTGDMLLLCTDGLTDLVEDEEIQQVLVEHDPLQAVERLTDMALERGGHDNITIVVLEVPQKSRRGFSKRSRTTQFMLWVVSLLGLGFLLGLGLAFIWSLGIWPWS
jgi:serine/threonine protein phosphatase PrpC